MRKLFTVLGVAAALSAAPLQAQAQEPGVILLGPTIAFADKDVGLGVGATVLFQLASIAEGLGFMGDFLVFFPDGFDFWEANINLTYDFPIEDTSVLPFVLAGLNIAHTSVDTDDVPGVDLDGAGATDLNFNLGGGIAFNAGSFRPRAGVRFVLGDGTRFVTFLTLPFQIAGG